MEQAHVRRPPPYARRLPPTPDSLPPTVAWLARDHESLYFPYCYAGLGDASGMWGVPPHFFVLATHLDST